MSMLYGGVTKVEFYLFKILLLYSSWYKPLIYYYKFSTTLSASSRTLSSTQSKSQFPGLIFHSCSILSSPPSFMNGGEFLVSWQIFLELVQYIHKICIDYLEIIHPRIMWDLILLKCLSILENIDHQRTQ